MTQPMEHNNTTSSEPSRSPKPRKKNSTLMIAAIVAVALIVGGAIFFAIKAKRTADATQQANEELLIEMAQRDLDREYSELNDEFSTFENQRQLVVDDSVKRELNDKYEAARVQIERLQQELASSERRSAAEISRLRNEITTLRNLLRHYVEEIDRLNQENQALRTENQQIRRENEQLNSRVSETSRRNEELSQRMTLAERLNVTGLTLTALNKKGKHERKVSKAKQLLITFTIPQNNSTPVGEKTIYARIVSPSGQLLEGGGSFDFEGGSVQCTAKKTIEYAGEEIGGIQIYYDVNTPLIAGDYTVELFADNFRLTSRNFTLQ